MKKYIFYCVTFALAVAGCKSKEAPATSETHIKLPFTASYTTEFTNDVPDSDLLVVLNSYKDWETGDLSALRASMADSQYFYNANGFHFAGLTDSLMNRIKASRDSLSSVKISMDVWMKNHAVKDNHNYINVWYKEIDTYKSGKVDSAMYEDINGLKNGKILYYASHKRLLKP